MFIVHLKNGEKLTLDDQCTKVDWSSKTTWVFIREIKNTRKILAIIPYESILWVENTNKE